MTSETKAEWRIERDRRSAYRGQHVARAAGYILTVWRASFAGGTWWRWMAYAGATHPTRWNTSDVSGARYGAADSWRAARKQAEAALSEPRT